MTREELISSREYLITNIQADLYSIIEEYMKSNKLKRKDLAEELGVSKGYISQVLAGDFDHKISKLVDLSLSVGKVPIVTFENKAKYIENDLKNISGSKHTAKAPVFMINFDSKESIVTSKENFIEVEKLAGNSYTAFSLLDFQELY